MLSLTSGGATAEGATTHAAAARPIKKDLRVPPIVVAGPYKGISYPS